jgi:hypothetical protein
VLNQPGQRGARGSGRTRRAGGWRACRSGWCAARAPCIRRSPAWCGASRRVDRTQASVGTARAPGADCPPTGPKPGGDPGGSSGGRPRGGCGVRCGRSPLVAHSALERLATQLWQGDRIARSAADMVVRAKRLPAIAPACPGGTAVLDKWGG